MAEFYARSNEQLSEFVRSASAGDTIYLAAGTYDTVWLRNLGDLDLTIASLDDSDPAIVTGLRLSGTSGVTFEGLVFEAAEGANNCFSVSGADDVHFSNVVVRGPDNVGTGEEVSPFMIRSSTNVSVTGSEFYQVKHALALLDVDGLVVSGNSFHDIRCDGVRGGGVSNALITNNMFSDFSPINTGGSGDHPDAIQLWSTAQDEPGRNITISDNLIYRGDGLPMQGIFIRDTFNNLPFENLTITGNVVLGGLYNGISVGGVIGGELTNNVVIAMDGQRSWIRVGADTDFVIEDNVATRYSTYNRDTPYDESNLTIEGGTDFVEAALRAWSASGSDMLADLTGILVGNVRPDLIPNGPGSTTDEPVPVATTPDAPGLDNTGSDTDPSEPASETVVPESDQNVTEPASPPTPSDDQVSEPSVMQPVTVIDVVVPNVPEVEPTPEPTPATRPNSTPIDNSFVGFGDDVAINFNFDFAARLFNPRFAEMLNREDGSTIANDHGSGINIELHELFTLQATHSMNSSSSLQFAAHQTATSRYAPSSPSVEEVSNSAFDLPTATVEPEPSIRAHLFGEDTFYAPSMNFARADMIDLGHTHIV